MKSINPSPSTNLRDCISILPDDVLSQVLSRMPIKDVVRTCVLSKDWEFKWKLITEVNIDVKYFPSESTKALTLISIVERVVFHLHTVKKLSLSCSCPVTSELSRITMLLSAILGRNIRHLRLVITENQGSVLPRSFVNCASLKTLYLQFETPCSYKVPVNNHFPNLKNLSLGGVKIELISDTDTLVFNFPVLEVLEIKECKWLKVKFVSIYVPSLLTFTSETLYEQDNNFDCSIKVHGAKIAELNVHGGYPENITLTGSTVDAVNLECYGFASTPLSIDDYGFRVRKLLGQVSDVKQLCVMNVLQAIGRTKLRGFPIPRFCKLKLLQMSFPIDVDGVLELLNASPYLEELELILNEVEDEYSLGSVPYCVAHHLKKLTIHYLRMYSNDDYDYRIEKFLLKNGAQLKTVTIQTLDDFPEKEMLDKFEMFPKASTSVKILTALGMGNMYMF